jgi:hypothetical protein
MIENGKIVGRLYGNDKRQYARGYADGKTGKPVASKNAYYVLGHKGALEDIANDHRRAIIGLAFKWNFSVPMLKRSA